MILSVDLVFNGTSSVRFSVIIIMIIILQMISVTIVMIIIMTIIIVMIIKILILMIIIIKYY